MQALENLIPLANPDIQPQDIESVVNVLKSGMLVQGKHVAELETTFCSFNQSAHANAVSNGTATMHLALIALGIGKGDDVIVPAFSYVATANVVELVGANCIFVDIDLKTFNIDVTKIEAAITTNTKAIIPVHEFGLACDIKTVMDIAKRNNLFVIEDAACALGATVNGKFTGTFGDFGSFSLHPRKSITCGEGGVLLTQKENLNTKIKQLRNHGVEMIDGNMEFVKAGFNYRMTDFQAALANSQMMRLSNTLGYKQTLAATYLNELDSSKITLPFVPEGHFHSWQTFHVLIDETKNQSAFLKVLREKNIGANYGAQCIPYQKYYQEKYGLEVKNKFSNAYMAYTKGIALPLYEKLNKNQISQISRIVNNI
jgi:perosamine synthetase